MENAETNWTKNEFKAYLFLYAANADYNETDTEKEMILELVNKKQYQKISMEFKNDSDFQCIQKIQHNIKKFAYSKNEIQNLFDEIKELFLSDGEFATLEKNMMLQLRNIIKNA